jgi:hypothetical protein
MFQSRPIPSISSSTMPPDDSQALWGQTPLGSRHRIAPEVPRMPRIGDRRLAFPRKALRGLTRISGGH